MATALTVDWSKKVRYMTDERENQIQKDLLWDYNQLNRKLEAFRVQFKTLAEKFDSTSKILRERPEFLADFDFSGLQEEFTTLIASAKEYRDMLARNAERGDSLRTMGII